MADVTLKIGDRHHLVACREGERAMLFVALMLADALNEAEHRPPTPGSASPATLEKLADRLESLAAALEQAGTTA